MAGTPLDRTPQGWDAVAEAYDTHFSAFTQRYAADALRFAGVKQGADVLDVAAGAGALALLAAKAGARVVATDFAPAMIERLRLHAAASGLRGLRAEVMDGQALALPDASFDAAFSIFGLMLFEDRAKGFRELHRVLRPGGRVAVAGWSTPDRVDSFTLLARALDRVIPDRPAPPSPPPVFSLADPSAFGREMTDAGFQDVRIHSVTHEWAPASPESAWDALVRGSPVFPGIFASVGPERARRIEEAYVDELRRHRTGGALVLRGEAHIGVGTR